MTISEDHSYIKTNNTDPNIVANFIVKWNEKTEEMDVCTCATCQKIINTKIMIGSVETQ